ncbi:MAG: hypothetical protein ACM3TR_08235 [Caulobacteraceae bacterium]
MTYDEYLEKLQRRFERHFIVETNVGILGKNIDLHARFCNVSGRTFITQSDVIDRCENYELCYIKRYEGVSVGDVAEFGEFLKRAVDEFVNPGDDHMSTYVTGVMITDNVCGDSARKAVEKLKHSKAYRYYLRGWCDVRLICVDLGNQEVITNKAGKRVKKVYQLTP